LALRAKASRSDDGNIIGQPGKVRHSQEVKVGVTSGISS
jgi:hypothetical protein